MKKQRKQEIETRKGKRKKTRDRNRKKERETREGNKRKKREIGKEKEEERRCFTSQGSSGKEHRESQGGSKRSSLENHKNLLNISSNTGIFYLYIFKQIEKEKSS